MKLRFCVRLILQSLSGRKWIAILTLAVSMMASWLLGSSSNTYWEQMVWNDEYQSCLACEEQELYLLYHRLGGNTAGNVGRGSAWHMYEQIRAVDGVAAVGGYQCGTMCFEELPTLRGFSDVNQTLFEWNSEEASQKYIQAVIYYGNISSMFNLWTEAGERVGSLVSQKGSEDDPYPLYIGYEYKDCLKIGQLLHQDGVVFCVEGILERESRMIVEGGYHLTQGLIDMDKCILVPYSPQLPSYIIGNQQDSTYYMMETTADPTVVMEQIDRILNEKGYTGWSRDVKMLAEAKKRELESESTSLFIFMALTGGMAMAVFLTAGIMNTLFRQKELGVWLSQGITWKDVRLCVCMEQVGIHVIAALSAAVILWKEVEHTLMWCNQELRVYSLADYVFSSRTIWFMFVFHLAGILLVVMVSLNILKAKTANELLKREC